MHERVEGFDEQPLLEAVRTQPNAQHLGDLVLLTRDADLVLELLRLFDCIVDPLHFVARVLAVLDHRVA